MRCDSCMSAGFLNRERTDQSTRSSNEAESMKSCGREDRPLLSIGVEFIDPARPDATLIYKIELVGGTAGYVNIQTEELFLVEGEKEHPLIKRENDGRWMVNADGQQLIKVHAERSAMELAPPNWDGYALKQFAQNWRYYDLVPSLTKQMNQVESRRSPRSARSESISVADVDSNQISRGVRKNN